jgi:hypothetical protein
MVTFSHHLAKLFQQLAPPSLIFASAAILPCQLPEALLSLFGSRCLAPLIKTLHSI